MKKILLILSLFIFCQGFAQKVESSFLCTSEPVFDNSKALQLDELPEQNLNYPYYVMIFQTPLVDPEGLKLQYYLLQPSQTDKFGIDKNTGVIYTSNHWVNYILQEEIFEFRIAAWDGENSTVIFLGIHICEACLQGLNPCFIY